MSLSIFVDRLRSNLSVAASILTDPESSDFQELCLRWSDINRRAPGAIIVAGDEKDVEQAVGLAAELSIPFVPCSGGHSLWSTIGNDGFILDLRRLQNITVDLESRQVTLQSGVLVGHANQVAWGHGLCLPLGTANTAGVIPMAIGGGLNSLSSVVGSASVNIISAKMVMADGKSVFVSSTSNHELFYALRGAGQCFGVVTELTLQAHPTSVLGSTDGTVWTGVMVFPIAKGGCVFEILSNLTEDHEAPTTGICIITSPPPTLDTSLIVIPVYFGESAAAEGFYQPLLQLEPFSTCQSIPYPRVNDAGEAFGVKGGFKRFSGAGLQRLDPSTWMQVVDRYERLKREFPDAIQSGYAVEWYKQGASRHRDETAFAHSGVRMWAELLSWYSGAESHLGVQTAEKDVLEIVRQGQQPIEYMSYPNWTRDDPIEHLFPGEERLARLRDLKRKWDPAGVFTRLFL
ncbi:FAD-binding domain-containing protein [Agrocybe pediades]|nr:FAD-binding domain-containing protein [Agrocybe pediades]